MIKKYIDFRKEILFYYSPYNHLSKIDHDLIFDKTVLNNICSYEKDNSKIIWEAKVTGETHLFLLKFLKWDTEFNKIPTYKLEYILFNHNKIEVVTQAIKEFLEYFFSDSDKYCFIEIPSEDIFLIQALGLCSFRLIETRINHYIDNPESYNFPRFKVRNANQDDITVLKEVAIKNRNNFDRLHADVFFDDNLADNYLATFIENAVNGFSDIVLVPDEPGIPPKAFLAANFLKHDSELLNCKINRLALAAVDPVCKGWFARLASEFVYISADMKAQYVMTTTQSTNRGSFLSVEKLGFKLGSVTHIFSTYKKNND